MPSNQDIDVHLRLDFEGRWPRSTYLAICLREGRAYDEQDYLRWREVGERLTGEPCFETQVLRAQQALASLGVSAAQAGAAIAKVFAPMAEKSK